MATLGRVEDRLIAVEERLQKVELAIETGLKSILEKVNMVLNPDEKPKLALTPDNWPITMTACAGEFHS